MIDGVNDRDIDRDALADFAYSLGAHVNLIPLNPTPGYPVIGTPADRVRAFANELNEQGVTTTVRATRGRSIDAACGQLANVTNGKRRRLSVRST
jgi:23S rRNA (adenine2503-C2)-methyltransferase